MIEYYIKILSDYTCVIYSPHHVYLIKFINNVQRTFTKRLFCLFNYSYCDRIQLCNLGLLELRGMRIDLTMIYKIMCKSAC